MKTWVITWACIAATIAIVAIIATASMVFGSHTISVRIGSTVLVTAHSDGTCTTGNSPALRAGAPVTFTAGNHTASGVLGEGRMSGNECVLTADVDWPNVLPTDNGFVTIVRSGVSTDVQVVHDVCIVLVPNAMWVVTS